MPDNEELSRDVHDPSRPSAEELNQSPSREFAGIPERLQNIRNSLRQERAAANAARSAAELSRRLRAATPPTSSSRLRMRAVLRQLRDGEADQVASANTIDNIERHTRLYTRAEERASRLASPAARRQAPPHFGRPPSNRSSLTSSFQDLEIRLAQANTELRSLLDSPLLSDFDATTTRQRTRARSRDDDYGGRRKRRRLNSTGADDRREIPQIEYGWHGQATPGKLKMQLVSSDGGICERHRDWIHSRRPQRAATMTSYAPENVLKDDKSVYSSRGSTCNMVLAHQDESIFTIERLIIKAPKHGFTDPVQEGLVFATMNQDDAFDRTCRFRMDNLSASWLMTDSECSAPHYESGSLHNLIPRNRSNAALDLSWPPLVPMRRHDCDSSSSSDTDSEDGDSASTNLFDLAGEGTSTRPTRGQSTWTRDLSDQDIERFARSVANIPTETFDRTESLARFDFDEVLRRGDLTAADRRRRRNTTGLRSGRDTPIPERAGMSDDEERFDALEDAAYRRDERIRLAFEAENKGLLVPLARFSMHRSPAGSSASSFARRRREQHNEQMQGLRERADALDVELRQSVLPPMRPPLHRDATSVLPPIEYLQWRDSENDTDQVVSRNNEANRVFQWQHHESTQPRRDIDHGRVRTATSEYKTVIRFDPPVDSRYLLLKLWNPKNTAEGTIDVRTIKVYGWAGPRWYPALEMR